MFPNIGVPQNGWFIRENPIKIYDLGVPLFLETPIYIYIHHDTNPGNLTNGLYMKIFPYENPVYLSERNISHDFWEHSQSLANVAPVT